MQLRRRAPRVEIDWSGWCNIGGHPESEVHQCRLVDLSLVGMGLELLGDGIGDVVGCRLVLDVEPPGGGSIKLHVVGQVVRQEATSEGRTRVGLELCGLSDSEVAVLGVIEQMRMFW